LAFNTSINNFIPIILTQNSQSENDFSEDSFNEDEIDVFETRELVCSASEDSEEIKEKELAISGSARF
jgi:hypothetical protein